MSLVAVTLDSYRLAFRGALGEGKKSSHDLHQRSYLVGACCVALYFVQQRRTKSSPFDEAMITNKIWQKYTSSQLIPRSESTNKAI